MISIAYVDPETRQIRAPNDCLENVITTDILAYKVVVYICTHASTHNHTTT
jgi:hypothetical protein